MGKCREAHQPLLYTKIEDEVQNDTGLAEVIFTSDPDESKEVEDVNRMEIAIQNLQRDVFAAPSLAMRETAEDVRQLVKNLQREVLAAPSLAMKETAEDVRQLVKELKDRMTEVEKAEKDLAAGMKEARAQYKMTAGIKRCEEYLFCAFDILFGFGIVVLILVGLLGFCWLFGIGKFNGNGK